VPAHGSPRVLWLLLFLVGCKDRVEYHRVEFPGFSFDTPVQMTYEKDPVAEYAAGQISWQGGGRLVTIGWQPGARATIEEMPTLVRTMGVAIPKGVTLEAGTAHDIQLNDHPATRIDARLDTLSLSLIDVECGKRSVMVGIGGVSKTDDLRARVLESFHCHPIEAQEQALGTSTVPFGVDDPAVLAGWQRMENEDAFTMTKDDAVVTISQIPHPDKAMAVIDKAMPAVLAATGLDWTNQGKETRAAAGGERTFQRGSVKMEGQTLAGVMALWGCEGRSNALMALALVPEEKDVPAVTDFIAKLRCPAPGDAPIEVPAAPPDAEEKGAE
jgi:hypothetical protein